jgi:phosphopentomutase
VSERRAIVIVLDSVGIGEAPDAATYDDCGAYTLQHTSACGFSLPTFEALGLGCIPPLLPKSKPIAGVSAVENPICAFGAMQEVSRGKDTTTGHWEIAGLNLSDGFHVFRQTHPSFPPELLTKLSDATGRATIGNFAASGTAIIDSLGEEHLRDGSWIVYTSADSVVQIAAHDDVVPLQELYGACEVVRKQCDNYPVGRVIARPFTGTPGNFVRTQNRRDFSFTPPEPTILDRLSEAGIAVTTVGKLDDIFAHRGMTQKRHVENNPDAMQTLDDLIDKNQGGFIFVNLIDFDMLYGHRRDPNGYARCLEATDAYLAQLLARLSPDDLLIITADHGNDPTFKGTDHTREFVPLLVQHPNLVDHNLGIRKGFFDVAQTLAAFFNIAPMPNGISFLPR